MPTVSFAMLGEQSTTGPNTSAQSGAWDFMVTVKSMKHMLPLPERYLKYKRIQPLVCLLLSNVLVWEGNGLVNFVFVNSLEFVRVLFPVLWEN